MAIKSKQLFILIGDDKTGKTILQKLLARKIADWPNKKMDTNLVFPILHPEIKRKYRNISFGNRSYQEKIGTYVSIENYFKNYFADADIAFISSHLVVKDAEEMIREGKKRFFNVNGVFFSNSIENDPDTNGLIAQLIWDERLHVDNPTVQGDEKVNQQLEKIAENIVTFISNRTSVS